MTDVLKTPEKKAIRRALIASALEVLKRDGWNVGREASKVKGRVRRISKNGQTHLAAIRTSQDGWIAFPRNRRDTKWVTLNDVDVVVAAAIDPAQPKVAQVHMFDAKELRARFDRAYDARKKAGHSIPLGRGIWISLYHEESDDPVNRIGAGIGLANPPIARVPLPESDASGASRAPVPPYSAEAVAAQNEFEPLTIAQAKVRLARTLGVDPTNIKITVEA